MVNKFNVSRHVLFNETFFPFQSLEIKANNIRSSIEQLVILSYLMYSSLYPVDSNLNYDLSPLSLLGPVIILSSSFKPHTSHSNSPLNGT